jgi:hypothetical protein
MPKKTRSPESATALLDARPGLRDPAMTNMKDEQSRERAQSPSHDDIACRAFDIYCGRGYEDGHDVEDWLQAEHELGGRSK